MADIEKVIKTYECCRNSWRRNCDDCPIKKDCCHDGLPEFAIGYALELLKEHEAKQVIKQTYHVMMNRDYENPVEVTRYDWLCPTCKSLLCRDIDVIDDNYHFCKVCGQAVKWE